MTPQKLLLAALVIALPAGASAQQTTGAAPAGTVNVQTESKQPYGSYLTDAHGRALYSFTADRKDKSICDDKCAQAWPPFTISGTPQPGTAVNRAKLDTIKRKDGKNQVTYNGMPLYYYAKDSGRGQTTGQDVKANGGQWYLVSPDGNKIEKETGKS